MSIRYMNEQAFAWIMGIEIKCWPNAFIEGQCYDILTISYVECTNGLLKNIRKLSITKQAGVILVKLIQFFKNCRDMSLLITARLSP